MKTEVKAMFQDFNAGAKKDVIKFEVKGDLTDEQIVALHKLKGGTVFVQISSSQMDMDDIEDGEREGVKYSVGGDGTVTVPPNQMSMDEVPQQPEQDGEQGTNNDDLLEQGTDNGDTEEKESGSDEQSASSGSVADIAQERKRRGRPRKEEAPENVEQGESETPPDNPPGHTEDDDLPF